jgi:hypothetical protein
MGSLYYYYLIITFPILVTALSKCGSEAPGSLGLWVWMSVSCLCCSLSVISLCDRSIPKSEDFYRAWCVTECDCEASAMKELWKEYRATKRIINAAIICIFVLIIQHENREFFDVSLACIFSSYVINGINFDKNAKYII